MPTPPSSPTPPSPSAQLQIPPLDSSELILIVVGAHLRAEYADRPTAYWLRERMTAWMDQHIAPGSWAKGDHPMLPLVCSDVWYMNQEDLRGQPTICIGSPGVNALSAFLIPRLAGAFAIEDRLAVQLDVTFAELHACCWGSDSTTTASAVGAFVERYLEGFMAAATAER